MPLSARDIISIWENGQECGPVYRALILLIAACPEIDWDKAQSLSIGERDRILLKMREETFGPKLPSYVKCPVCAEALEFELAVPELLDSGKSERMDWTFELPEQELKIIFRLPDSRDLMALGDCGSVQKARAALLETCILDVVQKGSRIRIQDLTEPVLRNFSEYMSACDPNGEIVIKMQCPACGHVWECILDIASFLWADVSTQAKRLLREVHLLASSYGWREEDILAMPALRRQHYLEMVL